MTDIMSQKIKNKQIKCIENSILHDENKQQIKILKKLTNV